MKLSRKVAARGGTFSPANERWCLAPLQDALLDKPLRFRLSQEKPLGPSLQLHPAGAAGPSDPVSASQLASSQMTAPAAAAAAPSPFTSNLSSPQLIMSPSYAQSGKILFAAAVFLCAVLPAAFCANAYRRRRAAERVADRPSTLAALPVSYAPTKEEAECAVCLSVLEGEQVTTLPGCGHIFHLVCINVWLLSHSTCPLCRSPVAAVAKPEPTAAAPSAPPAVCEWRGDLGAAATSPGVWVKLPTSSVLILAGMLFSGEFGFVREAEGGGGGGRQSGQVDLERGEAVDVSSTSSRSLENS